MPMFNPQNRGAATGSADVRVNSSWFSQIQRMNRIDLQPLPVMSNPPAGVLAKGSGLSGVSVVSGGTGYKSGETLDISGGTCTATARVKIVSVDESGVITAASVATPGIYSEFPTNPAQATGGSGADATFTLAWNAGVASSIYGGVTWNRTGTFFEYAGSNIKDSSPGYRGQGTGNGTQCAVEFCSDAPMLDFRFIGSLAHYELYVDGLRITGESISTDSSGAPYIYTINWNGIVRPRHYRLMGINTAFGGVITDAKSTVWPPTQAKRPLIWQLGDSYTYGTGATQPSFNDFRVMCDCLGFDGLADGIGGSGWTSSGSTMPQNRITSKLQTLSRVPEYISLSLGYNDAAAGRIETLQTNFRESVALIRQYCPLAKILVIGPATPLGSTTQLDAIRSAEMALCDELQLTFIDIDNWINSQNKGLYTGTDNTHPTDAGYWYRGARLAQAISVAI